jgi:PIN domain nuclease of toxin-antitoxin system
VHLLLDTQILVWLVNGDTRLRAEWIAAIGDPDNALATSAVTAFEYGDLQLRGRLPVDESVHELEVRFDMSVDPLPAECWRIASQLPPIHGDPVDRMTVAHALLGGYVLITADENMRRYPVDLL